MGEKLHRHRAEQRKVLEAAVPMIHIARLRRHKQRWECEVIFWDRIDQTPTGHGRALREVITADSPTFPKKELIAKILLLA